MYPDTKKSRITEINKNSLLNIYNRFPVEFIAGSGFKLYDSNGAEYIDFLCGLSVTNFGHNHPYIKAKANEQLNKLWHVSNLFESQGQNILADKLTNATGLHSVFFSNSGTEANEAAIKFARLWGNGKFEILTAINGFHGRTMGSLSATGQFELWNKFRPILPGFKYVEFGNIEALETNLSQNTVAVMMETIQGEGGINVPNPNYFTEVRKFCNKNNLLLIIDEIQTGIGRTGKYFAFQHYDIHPDIVTSAKALANGFPIGATICSERVSETVYQGAHGSTFGGNPVAIAAANAVTELLNDELFFRINQLGQYLSDKLNSLNNQYIKDVRGMGLMIGVEFNPPVNAYTIAKELLKNHIVSFTAKGNVLRIYPPFIISKKELDLFIINLEQILLGYHEDVI